MVKSSRETRTYKFLIVACLVSLICSTFASYFFYTKWNEATDRYMTTMNEKNVLAQNFVVIKNSFDKSFGDLLVIRDENAGVISFHAADSTKRYSVRVYWNHYTRDTFIDVLSLPLPDSSKQYQLWAISLGQPVDAGLFTSDPDAGIQRMKPVANAESWMVSLENHGGSASPAGPVVLIPNN